jgi:hypothetical protein
LSFMTLYKSQVCPEMEIGPSSLKNRSQQRAICLGIDFVWLLLANIGNTPVASVFMTADQPDLSGQVPHQLDKWAKSSKMSGWWGWEDGRIVVTIPLSGELFFVWRWSRCFDARGCRVGGKSMISWNLILSLQELYYM